MTSCYFCTLQHDGLFFYDNASIRNIDRLFPRKLVPAFLASNLRHTLMIMQEKIDCELITSLYPRVPSTVRQFGASPRLNCITPLDGFMAVVERKWSV